MRNRMFRGRHVDATDTAPSPINGDAFEVMDTNSLTEEEIPCKLKTETGVPRCKGNTDRHANDVTGQYTEATGMTAGSLTGQAREPQQVLRQEPVEIDIIEIDVISFAAGSDLEDVSDDSNDQNTGNNYDITSGNCQGDNCVKEKKDVEEKKNRSNTIGHDVNSSKNRPTADRIIEKDHQTAEKWQDDEQGRMYNEMGAYERTHDRNDTVAQRQWDREQQREARQADKETRQYGVKESGAIDNNYDPLDLDKNDNDPIALREWKREQEKEERQSSRLGNWNKMNSDMMMEEGYNEYAVSDSELLKDTDKVDRQWDKSPQKADREEARQQRKEERAENRESKRVYDRDRVRKTNDSVAFDPNKKDLEQGSEYITPPNNMLDNSAN